MLPLLANNDEYYITAINKIRISRTVALRGKGPPNVAAADQNRYERRIRLCLGRRSPLV